MYPRYLLLLTQDIQEFLLLHWLEEVIYLHFFRDKLQFCLSFRQCQYSVFLRLFLLRVSGVLRVKLLLILVEVKSDLSLVGLGLLLVRLRFIRVMAVVLLLLLVL